MTKFEAYMEKVQALREKRRNEEWNLQLLIGLKTRTHKQVVQEFLSELNGVSCASDIVCVTQSGNMRELLA